METIENTKIKSERQDNLIKYIDFDKLLKDKSLNEASLFLGLSRTKLQYAMTSHFDLKVNDKIIKFDEMDDSMSIGAWSNSAERKSFQTIKLLGNKY